MKEQLNKERLELLQQEELELHRKLAANQIEQREINIANWENEHQIKIGDDVQFYDGRKFINGRLSHFDFSGTIINHPMVQRFKSDDTPGKFISRVWNHQLKTLKKI